MWGSGRLCQGAAHGLHDTLLGHASRTQYNPMCHADFILVLNCSPSLPKLSSLTLDIPVAPTSNQNPSQQPSSPHNSTYPFTLATTPPLLQP